MKKIRVVILFAVLFILTSCNQIKNLLPDYMPYNEIPGDYSLENAKKDGCVVFENSNITSGQIVWDNFIEQTEKKKSCFVRLVYYFTIGDPERYSPDYYEEIKDDYPQMFIWDLKFDGKKYIYSGTEEDNKYSFTYNYMKKYTGEPSSSTAIFSDYIYYVLVNDDTVTWEQIEHGIFSPQLGDYIDHKKVYSYYRTIYK